MSLKLFFDILKEDANTSSFFYIYLTFISLKNHIIVFTIFVLTQNFSYIDIILLLCYNCR